jgi:hypothetical protein
MSETGVIVGVSFDLTDERGRMVVQRLEDRFPGVTFAVVTGASSLAFEFTRPAPFQRDLSGYPLDLDGLDDGGPR